MMNLLTTLSAATVLAGLPLSPFALQAPTPAPAPQVAAPAIPPLTEAERTKLLADVSVAMANVKTARGIFEQVSPDGSLSTGKFALARPGKVRFEYDDPVPLLIVADGTTVAMKDTELETVDRIPLSATPLALLLDDKLDFDSEADVLDIVRNDTQLGITIADPNGEVDGELQLIFSADDLELDSWVATDSGGNRTNVKLRDVQTGKRLNPRLFINSNFEE